MINTNILQIILNHGVSTKFGGVHKSTHQNVKEYANILHSPSPHEPHVAIIVP